MNGKERELIFKELLAVDNDVRSFMTHAYNLPGSAIPADPSWVWEQIRFNPHLAMSVFDDIEEKDDMVATALETRKDSVLAKSRRVLPASQKRQDKKVAEFIEETLEGGFVKSTNGVLFGMDNLLFEALDAIGKGVSVGEIIYDSTGDRVYIKDVKFHPQQLFSFSATNQSALSASTFMQPQTGPLRLRPGLFGHSFTSEEVLPESKFFVHTYRPRHSNRWGTPLVRKVFWLSWFKRAGTKQWLRYLEKGSGTVISKYNDGASADEQNTALEAARAANEETAIAIPAKFVLEVLQHVRQSMGTAFGDLVDNLCNNGIARVILGQTLTSRGGEGGGGARALGEVHERVSATKTEVDSKSAMLAFNMRLVWPLVLMNYGPNVPSPVWAIDYEPGNDLTVTSEWLKNLHEMRVPLSKNYVYNAFAGTRPESEDDVLEGKGEASPSPRVGVKGEGPEFAEAASPRLEREAEAEVWIENGTLRGALPLYRAALGHLVDAVARLDNLKLAARDSFLSQFDATFDTTFEVLGDGLLAAYLLARSQVQAARAAEFDEPLQMGFEVPPREAIAYFRGKKVVTPKQFNALVSEARGAAFTVGGIYKGDVLEAVKEEIARALEAGTPQREVVNRFRAILDGAGHPQLGTRHLETVWRTNCQVAYGTGRRHALEEVKADLPLWRYNAVMDDRTRPEHAALDGIIFPADHPFWDDHFPPWGFACRCNVTPLMREPGGYDSKNPSGQAELAFDARGVPLKAESGTAVYDLSAGKFKGIPRQGGLREVVEAGTNRAKEK